MCVLVNRLSLATKLLTLARQVTDSVSISVEVATKWARRAPFADAFWRLQIFIAFDIYTAFDVY